MRKSKTKLPIKIIRRHVCDRLCTFVTHYINKMFSSHPKNKKLFSFALESKKKMHVLEMIRRKRKKSQENGKINILRTATV